MTFEQYKNSILFQSAADGLALVQSLAVVPYVGAVLRVAFHLSDRGGEWELLTGNLTLCDQVEETRAGRIYPVVELSEEWMSLERIAELLRVTPAGVSFAVPNARYMANIFDYATGERCYTQSLPDLGGERAGVRVAFEANARRGASVRNVPALAKGLPTYRSIVAAASDWCFGKQTRYSADFGERGRLVVIAPEVRANICGAKISRGVLSIRTKVVPPAAVEASVVFAFGRHHGDDSAGPSTAFMLTPGAAQNSEVEVPDGAVSVSIFLAGQDNEFLAHTFARCVDVGDDADQAELARHEVEDDIAAGESDRVEFKPWPEKRDTKGGKIAEMIRVVIAFANTNGGRLYVGVEDDGGLSPLSALEPYGASLDERLAAITQLLDRAFRNGIIEVPDYEIRVAAVRGAPLVVVDVQGGDRRPYATAPGREIFVRRGASCLRPDPHGELAAMFRENGPSS